MQFRKPIWFPLVLKIHNIYALTTLTVLIKQEVGGNQ